MELFLQAWQPLVADWLALTLANPAYAATIAGIVWLLTAMLGAIRARSLKKLIVQRQQALDDASGQLQIARQNVATTQEQLLQAQADADQARQSAQLLQTLLLQRNNQVAGVIQSLSISFDMGERPVPVTDDVQAEALWEQHGRAVNQLVASLRAESQAKTAWQNDCQSEAAKRAALEAQVMPLQAMLGEHSGQIEALVAKQNDYLGHIALLQQKLTEQNELYQQLEQQTEASLEHFAQSHAADAQRLQELEQQLAELENYKTQNKQLQEALTAQESEIARWQDQADNALPVTRHDAVAKFATHNNGAVSSQALLASPVLPDDSTKTDPAEEPVVSTMPNRVLEPPVEEPAGQAEAHNPLGFMKNLFGKNKPVPVEEITEVEESLAEAEPELVVADVEAVVIAEPEEQQHAGQAEEHNPLGFMKNLFGKNKPAAVEPIEAVAETEPEPDTLTLQNADVAGHPVPSDPLGFMKNIFKNKQPVEIEPPLPIVEEKYDTEIAEPVADNPALGFMKKLFAKAEPAPIVLEPEPEPPLAPEETPAKPSNPFKFW